jgi:2,4-dienoyl-CoA reductase (NADPH2)
MANKKFEKLLEPGQIGTVKLKNRMIKSGAAARYWGSGDNQINDISKHYYEAFARGGVGLIIVEGPVIEPVEARMSGNYRLDDDKYIKGVFELTELIHKHKCPAFVQLNHNCNWQRTMLWQKQTTSDPPKGASPVCVKSLMDNNNEMPREITIPELHEIKSKIGDLAVRLEKAGFDGIEINAASTHLIHSFLSPFWNKRTDAYGCQNLENRTRFLVEIVQEIKKRLGKDYPVSIIVNGIEIGNLIGVENTECLTSADVLGISKIIQGAGVDAIQVRSQWLGRHDSSFLTDHFYYPEPPISPGLFPAELDISRRGAGANRLLAAAIKNVVSIPVMTVGRLDPELGEQMLRAGQADFICFTRRLIADPEMPNKVAAGRLDDIAPCTSCTTCKVMGAHRRCRINAATGTDKSYIIEPAGERKKVVVVGGGPAGMEAARVAALRGHQVILFEKTSSLGGLLPLAAMVKGLDIEDLPAIIQYLKTQITKLHVDVRLGKELDSDALLAIKPDVVIVATGGIINEIGIAGINRANVVSNAKLHQQLKFFLKFAGPRTLNWLSKFWIPLGKTVIIIGGGIQGCELAEFLVKRGRKVTVVDKADVLGEGMVNHLRLQLFDWFAQKGVTLVSGVKEYVGITEKGLVVLTAEGYKRTIQADNVIPALPMRPNTELFRNLKGKVKEMYAVGDCHEPKLIVDAIEEGFRIARLI